VSAKGFWRIAHPQQRAGTAAPAALWLPPWNGKYNHMFLLMFLEGLTNRQQAKIPGRRAT
jgi:hypothetical protein